MTDGVREEPGTHRFDTVASRDIYRGRVLALRADEVAMPDGQVAVREVVEHYGAVAIAAVDEQHRVVLIHQYRHPLGHRVWELPAGLLDQQGEPPAVAAGRELAEEVGLAALDWSVLVDVAASPGFTDEVVRVFLARDLSPAHREQPVGDEEADLVVRRVELADAVRMVLAGEVVNSSSVGGILAAHAVLTGGAETRPVDAPWPDRPTRLAGRG
ncbi:MAG TPA: NUDIX hydrolase [Pseudonocardiaceae bacterium]|jgi:ADP-ribose pyrophosphatase|nr:NUDIX hydrolase [Pseudonocardiaceae bacterium]